MKGSKGVRPADFYDTAREKNNLNWYCYELAIGFEEKLGYYAGRPRFKRWVLAGAVQQMAIDLSKQLRQVIITKELTAASGLLISSQSIKKHMQDAPGTIAEEVASGLNEVIRWQATSCRGCPSHCLKHKDTRCPMFDDPLYATPLGEAGLDEDELLGGDPDDGAGTGIDGQGASMDEYSDDVLEKCVERAIAYWKDFARSDYFSRLTEREKEKSRSIVESFADKMYSYHLATVEKWNVPDMEDVCIDVIPRKMTAEDEFFEAIGPVLSAYFQYLGTRGGILPDAAALSDRARAIGPAIAKTARDPENWGMAKSFAMAAHDAGYDLSNEDDMGKAMAAYNAKALANYLAGKRPGPAGMRPGPAVPGAPDRTRKVGRNERCPCGSGLKYKRCCGRPIALIRTAADGRSKPA